MRLCTGLYTVPRPRYLRHLEADHLRHICCTSTVSLRKPRFRCFLLGKSHSPQELRESRTIRTRRYGILPICVPGEHNLGNTTCSMPLDRKAICCVRAPLIFTEEFVRGWDHPTAKKNHKLFAFLSDIQYATAVFAPVRISAGRAVTPRNHNLS